MTSPDPPPNDVTKSAITLFWCFIVFLTIILAILHHFNVHNFGTWHWLWIFAPVLIIVAIGVIYIIFIIIATFIQLLRGK